MSKRNLENIESRIINNGEHIRSIDNTSFITNIILFIGLLIIIGVSMVSCTNLEQINQRQISIDSEESIVAEGCVERIRGDSIMLNGRMYKHICDDDVGMLNIGDKVILEKSYLVDGSWNACDEYRLTIVGTSSKKNNSCT